MGFEFFDGGAQVFDLEGEAGPGALAFAAAMDANDSVGDLDFGPGLGLHGHGAIEEVAVKGNGALPIGGPESIFGFEDGHE